METVARALRQTHVRFLITTIGRLPFDYQAQWANIIGRGMVVHQQVLSAVNDRSFGQRSFSPGPR